MKSTTAFSVVRVLRAAQYSEKGLRAAWRDEAAFRQELVLVLLLAPLTLWLSLPSTDTVLLISLMGLVLVVELLNSGLEAIVDMASPDIHSLAAKAKDCGSAAVFVALITLFGAWLALAGPTLWALATSST
jgi:diacylglycerol kinase (ATP)